MNTQKYPRYCVVVPTRNGGTRWIEAADALQQFALEHGHVLVVDSESTDATAEIARTRGFEVRQIKAADFNHGTTRQAAIDSLGKDTEFVVMLTQDAVLNDKDSISALLESFADPRVSAAFGRQIPHTDAECFEAHGVIFNYPDWSETRTQMDIPRLGIKTAYFSNSFAAYRLTALRQCGGFPDHLILGEDAFVAMRMLLAGSAIRYCAEARVRHSHRYTIGEEFRRYFDFGVLHAQLPELVARFGRAEGEGLRYVLSELRYVGARAPYKLPSAPLRSVAKYVGYQLGRHHDRLRPNIKKRFSMTRVFWDSVAGRELNAATSHGKRAQL